MKEKLPFSKQICYAIGQLGWSMLVGIINSYVVYYYFPPKDSGIPITIPQGTVLGVLTVIGLITMSGRFFDAITDPWIASLSDRCTSKRGRRIPFMAAGAIPVALFTVLIYFNPVPSKISGLNVAWLAFTLLAFYLFLTVYVTPYFALMSELGHNASERLNLSTYISATYFIGTAIAFQAPVIWTAFINKGMNKISSMRLTFIILSAVALIFMLIPVFTIDEYKYSEGKPSNEKAIASLKSTFKNKQFLIFVFSAELVYFVALTIFMTGLMYYVTVLLKQPESLYSLLSVMLGVMSFIFYPVVNVLAKKYGKKKLILIAFIIFIVMYALSALLGKEFVPIPNKIQAYVLVIIASFPMAVFGILPNAVVADIAESDAKRTGTRREAMFFGACTFMQKIGQMISMALFSSLLLLGKDIGNDLGVRLTAVAASIICLLGFILFLKYDEKQVYIENSK